MNGYNQIAEAAEEQTTVAEEINRNINNINHVSNETATATQQMSEACQNLQDLAEQLRRAVSSFKT